MFIHYRSFFSFSLRIKHNDLKKYFMDYNEYYPSGLSFQLAIQVFWRPKQLTEGRNSLILIAYFN